MKKRDRTVGGKQDQEQIGESSHRVDSLSWQDLVESLLLNRELATTDVTA